MRISSFNYELPEELIAQKPPDRRGTTRLLVLDRTNSSIQHRRYSELADYIQSGDLIILNDTKVIKARLLAKNSKNQERELLLLEDHHNTDFMRRKALYRGKIHQGEILTVRHAEISVQSVLDGGVVEISSDTNLLDLAEQVGSIPLPPYMKREASKEDIERYQTVFARHPGSIAAPTASLNFTDELQSQIVAKSASIAYLTLHVGLGTFLPIRSDDIEKHDMHSEYFEIPASTISMIKAAKTGGHKIFAVGTTVTRTLEYCADKMLEQESQDLSGEADIFIYPGYGFKVVDALLTNFHAPKSTVLMMAAAFAGWEDLQLAYDEAIKEKYAFLSYGDSMLIC